MIDRFHYLANLIHIVLKLLRLVAEHLHHFIDLAGILVVFFTRFHKIRIAFHRNIFYKLHHTGSFVCQCVYRLDYDSAHILDLFCRRRRIHCQLSDFVRYYRKAPAGFPCSGCFDTCIQCQQVRLIGNVNNIRRQLADLFYCFGLFNLFIDAFGHFLCMPLCRLLLGNRTRLDLLCALFNLV